MAIKSESRLSVGHNARPFNEQTGCYHSWGSWQLQQFLYIRYHSCSFSPWSYKNKWNKTSQTNIKKLTWKKPIACDCFGLGSRWRQEEQYLEKNVEFVEFSRPTVELWSSRKEWKNQPNFWLSRRNWNSWASEKGRRRKHGWHLAPNRDCLWAEGSILHTFTRTHAGGMFGSHEKIQNSHARQLVL